MIKFQPLLIPQLEDHTHVPCSIIFDKIDIKSFKAFDENTSVIPLNAKWNNKSFLSMFFMEGHAIPQVVMMDPVMIALPGVLVVPTEYAECIQDFENVALSCDVQEESRLTGIIRLLADIESDADIDKALALVEHLKQLGSLSQEEYEALSHVVIGAPKLFAYVLKKAKELVV